MKKISSLFLFSLFTLSVAFFSSCDKDQPAPPPSCDDFAVVVAQQGNDQLIANATGGSTPYSYLWTGGATTQAITIDYSLAGDYGVTVTDANGCTAEATFNITASNPCTNFSASIALNGNILTASNTEGTAPFTYLWSNGSTTSTLTVDLYVSADYSVTISDANGCSTSADYSITALNPCDSTDLAVEISFSNDNLLAEATGGSAPYSYQWNDGATTSTLANVAEGTYSITITDSNGCTAQDTYIHTISGCSDFAVDIFKNDSITTSIYFEAITTAGTAPFSYLWGGVATGTSSFIELPNGTSASISVTVTDANGCTALDTKQF